MATAARVAVLRTALYLSLKQMTIVIETEAIDQGEGSQCVD